GGANLSARIVSSTASGNRSGCRSFGVFALRCLPPCAGLPLRWFGLPPALFSSELNIAPSLHFEGPHEPTNLRHLCAQIAVGACRLRGGPVVRFGKMNSGGGSCVEHAQPKCGARRQPRRAASIAAMS